MNLRLLQSSFVGVWEKPLPNIPPIDRKFLLDLFEDPYYTNVGLNHEGLVITHMVDSPRGSIIINANRIQVSSPDYAYTSHLSTRIYEALTSIPGFLNAFPYSSIGINSEIEVSSLPYPARDWLSGVFFGEFRNKNPDLVAAFPYHIRFEMKTANNLRLNFLIQLSTGDENAVHVSLNDDKFWSEKPHPTRLEIEDFFLDSNLELNTRLKKLLN